MKPLITALLITGSLASASSNHVAISLHTTNWHGAAIKTVQVDYVAASSPFALVGTRDFRFLLHLTGDPTTNAGPHRGSVQIREIDRMFFTIKTNLSDVIPLVTSYSETNALGDWVPTMRVDFRASGPYALMHSTNLVDWSFLAWNTNAGAITGTIYFPDSDLSPRISDFFNLNTNVFVGSKMR
jgi:hypothetical protein